MDVSQMAYRIFPWLKENFKQNDQFRNDSQGEHTISILVLWPGIPGKISRE